MPEFLVGLMFHEPEPFAQWKSGLIEDYESSTGIFVHADSASDALRWGELVAQALLRHVNRDESLDWYALGYICWLEESPAQCAWKHCLSFFQHIRVGEMPDFEKMTSAAYGRWMEQNGLGDLLRPAK